MDEPFASHMTFPVCLPLLFPTTERGHYTVEKQGAASRLCVGGRAGRPRGRSRAILEKEGASFFPRLVQESSHPLWLFLFQPITFCSWHFVDLIHFIPPPPIVLSRPAKWCHGAALKVYRKSSKLNDFNLPYSVYSYCWLHGNHTPQNSGSSLRTSGSSQPLRCLPCACAGYPPPPSSQSLGERPDPRRGEKLRARKARGMEGQRRFLRKIGVQDS